MAEEPIKKKLTFRQKVRQQVTNESREQMLARLKEEVRSGKYLVDGEKVADAMLSNPEIEKGKPIGPALAAEEKQAFLDVINQAAKKKKD